jgi:hypothetical protein
VVVDCCIMGKSGHQHFNARSQVPQSTILSWKRYLRVRVVVDNL